jgi:hypothetical protein
VNGLPAGIGIREDTTTYNSEYQLFCAALFLSLILLIGVGMEEKIASSLVGLGAFCVYFGSAIGLVLLFCDDICHGNTI